MAQADPSATHSDNTIELEELKRAISSLGAVVLKLQSQSGKTLQDAETIEELQRRYSVLRGEFEELENAGIDLQQGDEKSVSQSTDTLDQIKSTAQSSWEATREKFSTAYNDLRDYATNEENQRAFKKSADDVGKGFADAWNSLAASFKRAYRRFSTDENGDETSRRPNTRTTSEQ